MRTFKEKLYKNPRLQDLVLSCKPNIKKEKRTPKALEVKSKYAYMWLIVLLKELVDNGYLIKSRSGWHTYYEVPKDKLEELRFFRQFNR